MRTDERGRERYKEREREREGGGDRETEIVRRNGEKRGVSTASRR